ncbi:MAG: class D sortase [Acidimicrobiales bacterium]
MARNRSRYRLLLLGGAILVTLVAAAQIYVDVWNSNSARTGQALVHQFLKNRSLASPVDSGAASGSPPTASLATCGSSMDTTGVQGVINIPKLNVVAPVLQGTDGAELNVAVGHDPYSVWPGSKGNSVLEAHDVSYFQNLPNLAVGDTITYESPCTTYSFVVQSHSEVAQGSLVYNTPNPSITLVTCWPTNALWFTPDRYLVTANEVSSSATSTSPHTFLTASSPPKVPVPAALEQQGVTLATYSVPMGIMSVTGSPDSSWSQTTNPLLVQSSAVEGFVAGLRSLNENRIDWWRAVAPTVPAPTALVGASTHFLTALNVDIQASGAQAIGAVLSVTLRTNGGTEPGGYSMIVAERINDGSLTISSWQVQPNTTDGA